MFFDLDEEYKEFVSKFDQNDASDLIYLYFVSVRVIIIPSLVELCQTSQ